MKLLINFKLILLLTTSIFFHFDSAANSRISGQYSAPNKVIAIGDIHGAYAEFHQLLTELKLINEQDDWIGGDTYLVSLGDLLDRGADSRKVIDLIIKLQQQAIKSDGKVIQVLGNHELMVTTGDYGYVSKEEFAAFNVDESERQRKDLFNSFKQQNTALSADEQRQQFNTKFPPGYSAYIQAFSSKGKYGKWLREALPVIKVNNSLFVHGGLSSDLFDKSLSQINQVMDDVWEYQAIVERFQDKNILPYTVDYWQRVNYLNTKLTALLAKKNRRKKAPKWYDDFLRLHELQNSSAFQDNSPMWYRGNAYCHPYSESFNTERLLKQLDAEQIIVGHTPLYKQLTSRINQQVFLADTGMLNKVYHGNATALIFDKGHIQTFLLGQDGVSPVPAEENKYSVGSTTMTDSEIEDFLFTGEVIHSKKIGVGVTNSSVITLEKNGKTIRAIFKTFDSDPRLEYKKKYPHKRSYVADRYNHEIAAYRIDRMLELNQVAVAVKRTIKRKTGVVQYWVDGLRNEKDREEKGKDFISYCPQIEQYRTRYIFDVLIYNDDRNQTNLTFSKDQGMLYLIDHSIAFGLSKTKPDMYKNVNLRLSSTFRAKLESLTLEELKSQLDGLLSNGQIKAIIERRDLILESALKP